MQKISVEVDELPLFYPSVLLIFKGAHRSLMFPQVQSTSAI